MLRRQALIASVVAILSLSPVAVAVAAGSAPDGYEIVAKHGVAAELEHRTLRSKGPDQVVHLTKITKDGPYALRTVMSNDSVVGTPGLERTSSMCKRIDCLIAINGDFAMPGTREPVGGAVSLGEPLRSPNGRHHQLVIGPDGTLSAGTMRWSARLVATDLRGIEIDGVNVPRTADRLVLYTPANGPTTGTNPHGVEMPLKIKAPADTIRLDTTAAVRLGKLTKGGNSKIPTAGAVLSGHGAGADALRDLVERIGSKDAGPDALLRIESDPKVSESVGGSPVLVRDGKRWFSNDPTAFVRGRHPRTVVGWTPDGDVLLVTVDGRQPGYSQGMSLAEVADLMIGLGVTEAINLDGGGSTTFVVRGDVVNKPSDRLIVSDGRVQISATGSGDRVKGYLERPVVSALAVVPKNMIALDPAPAPTADDITLPQALALPVPMAADPASDPTGALPAMVSVEPASDERTVLVLVASLAVATVVLAFGLDRARATRRKLSA